ncbi:MAG: DUF4364 family protein [Ruminiclostridium sp.]|nr:DUF4364 family protein [Ruminiclostridium sp.]MCF0136765.1 DUF4364 family protein [Oscillospiraceae bacterium]
MEERFGFIHEKLDIKILILFVLRRLPGVVDRNVLSDLVQQCDGGVGYFDYSDCLYELVDAGQVSEEEDGFRITDKGAVNGETVESSLPYSVRKKAEKVVAPEAERLRRLAMLTAEHRLNGGNCTVILAMDDGQGEILRLELLVADEEQAKRMEKYFKKNAETLYGELVEKLDSRTDKH